jgi:hypothetical protein
MVHTLKEVKTVKGKTVIVLLSTLVVLMLLVAASPVFAYIPEHGTFTQGITQVTTSPGTTVTIGNMQFSTGSVASAYLFGAPWGNSISSTVICIFSQMNTQTYVGNSVYKTTDVYAKGVVEGVLYPKTTGVGYYTYNGPTFSFSLAGMSGTWTHGATYFGVLGSGFAYKHGVSGALKGLQTYETFTFAFVISGPNAGALLVDNTVNYWLP